MSNYIPLGSLKVYQMAVELENYAWGIYIKMDWQIKKVIGDQFIRAMDSMGSNVAEGYGRYHYLDKVKFYYNARGSQLESNHWVLMLYNRKIITKMQFEHMLEKLKNINRGLNELINSTKRNLD